MKQRSLIFSLLFCLVLGIAIGFIFSQTTAIFPKTIFQPSKSETKISKPQNYQDSLAFADGSQYTGGFDPQGLLSGVGELRYSENEYFRGEFLKGRFDGVGKFVFGDGTVMRGQFKEGRLFGYAEIQYPDGSSYLGQVENFLSQGYGVLNFASCERYLGEFKQNKMAGYGVHYLTDGSSYQGQMKDNLYEGLGFWNDGSGSTYAGQFKSGFMEGLGQYRMEGGAYTGQFLAGNFTGEGAYHGDDGSFAEGEYTEWSLQGYGTYQDADGSFYAGTFENGLYHGFGKSVFKDGRSYLGAFAYGGFSDFGEYTSSEGHVYQGGFEHGSFHGWGEYRYADPVDEISEYQGRWQYGSLVEALPPMSFYQPEEIAEFALYNQEKKLQIAAEKIAVSTSGIDLFTLAIAGYGREEVFRREINYVRKLPFVDESRSMYLINSRRNLDEPFATKTSIKRALAAIGKAMSDEDVLFLYMTSHGSKKEFTLQHTGVNLPNIAPRELRQMLDDAGIPRRIIVVSACYSGIFVEPLADDNAIVITASSAEKTSFGCSDDNAWTFFGEAFLKHGLTEKTSFVEAFDVAAELVSEWEAERDYKASEPQIRASKQLVHYLKGWEEKQMAHPLNAQ